MPTYEYECEACNHCFEQIQSMSDAVIRKCPKCKRLKVRRIISGGAGFIFKGSGFYETDYKRNRSESETAKRRADEGGGDAAPKNDDAAKKPDASETKAKDGPSEKASEKSGEKVSSKPKSSAGKPGAGASKKRRS